MRWFIVVGLSLLLVLLSGRWWLPAIGTFLVVADPLHPADALVILAGDEDARLASGAHLFQQGIAEWYLVTDMQLAPPNPPGRYATVVTRKALRLGVPDERLLVVPGPVATTYEEVVAIRRFADQRGFRSLLVVTSPYHTRRARWILHEVFDGSDVRVSVQPVAEHPYRGGSWWRTADGRQQTGWEYAKLLAHLLGCRHQGCPGLLPLP